MPASRSRTENWRRSLEQVCERNGGLEIAIPRPGDAAWPSAGGVGSETVSLIWRVRLLDIRETELLIEAPSTLGQHVDLHYGLHLIVVYSLGQNRWMFRSKTLGRMKFKFNHAHNVMAIRLSLPDIVERCQRRQFYRVPTVGLLLPRAEARPIHDARTVIPAETAVQTRIEMLRAGQIAGYVGAEEPLLKPDAGPPVEARLVNLGGGGAGLMVESDAAGVFNQHRLFWVTFHLSPHVPAPLSVLCKLAHIRIDSEQRRYLGMSFEFEHNPQYRQFVTNTLCRCINEIQRDQLKRRTMVE